jgi:hypothetical protein
VWVALVEDHCQDHKLCQVSEVDDTGLRGNIRAQVKGAPGWGIPWDSPERAKCYQLQQKRATAAVSTIA